MILMMSRSNSIFLLFHVAINILYVIRLSPISLVTQLQDG